MQVIDKECYSCRSSVFRFFSAAVLRRKNYNDQVDNIVILLLDNFRALSINNPQFSFKNVHINKGNTASAIYVKKHVCRRYF